MKVFSLNFDHRRYQMIDAMPGLVDKHPPTHAGAPLLQDWEPLTATVDNPTKRRGDFLLCGLSYFVCKHEITQALSKSLQEDVQVLPVQMQAEAAAYDLWNISNFLDALDVQRTQFKPPPFRSQPAQWAFKPECFDRPMLFRTHTVSTIPLVVTDVRGEADAQFDFYRQCQRLKLRGLKFELLWEQEC
jgi:hypothetical protein